MYHQKPLIGIKGRNQIQVLNSSCNLNGVQKTNAQIFMDGDYILMTDANEPESPLNLPMLGYGREGEIWNGIDRSRVENIMVLDHKNVPANAIKSWDASMNKDGSVMAWYVDSNNNGLYEVYIGGENGVQAPSDSTALFAYFENVSFIEPYYLDTSKVTNMSAMFAGNFKLKYLDLENMDTRNVTNMSAMFKSNIGLVGLSLDFFDTWNLINVDSMFMYCRSLERIGITSFDFNKISMYDNMFTSVPILGRIHVKNQNSKDKLELKYPNHNFVIGYPLM